MEKAKIDRINELAKFAKERELTQAEQDERAILRREYIDEWKNSTKNVLENVYIDDGNGNISKLDKK